MKKYFQFSLPCLLCLCVSWFIHGGQSIAYEGLFLPVGSKDSQNQMKVSRLAACAFTC